MLSVIIPTYNRLPILREVLAALAACDVPRQGREIVVVSDGSEDGTNEWLAGFKPQGPFRFLVQPNSGPACARNLGVKHSTGDRILFIGDDTVPARDLLVRHCDRAAREPSPDTTAVLGYTCWHPRIRVSPFLDHINEYGLQFGFSIIPDPENVPFHFFYASNVSVSRRLFEQLGGFDTSFPNAAWEDVEFAYRARKLGMRMVYEPAALTRHDHNVDIRGFLRRQERVGASAATLLRKHPELTRFLGANLVQERRRLRRRLKNRGGRLWLLLSQWVPALFSAEICDAVMRDAYFTGLARGLERETATTRPAGDDAAVRPRSPAD